MVNGGNVQYWTCLNFSTRVSRDLPHQFCNELLSMCISKGMVSIPLLYYHIVVVIALLFSSEFTCSFHTLECLYIVSVEET